MNYSRHFTVLFLSFLIFYFSTRSFISGVIDYCLNTSARKKRRKGQTFKEWFFYTRFRDVIPKIMLVWYFGTLWVFVFAVVVVIIMALVNFDSNIVMFFCVIILHIAVFPGFIAYFMFKNPKAPGGWDHSRWIKRKKRNKK